MRRNTREGAKILRGRVRRRGRRRDAFHVPWNQEDYPRDRAIRKTLFACDELCGFIFAAALVRPTRMEGMDASGVIKKMKQKAFAASVSREDIHEGAALLELPLERHVSNCIQSLQTIAVELGLTGE